MLFRPSSNAPFAVPVGAPASAAATTHSFDQRFNDDDDVAHRPDGPRRRHDDPDATASERSLSGLLAPDDDRLPTFAARMLVFPVLFIPWLILYSSIVNLGPMPDAFETYRAGEWRWPVYQWTELLYFSPYVLVTIAPFLIRTNRLLRRFTVTGILGTVIGHLVFLVVPAMATPRPFAPHGVFGAMMEIERQLDGNGAGALPSFHVFWAFLGGAAFAARWPRWRRVAWSWAIAVSLSCVFTGLHSMLDIIAGFAMFLLIYRAVCNWDSAKSRLAARGSFVRRMPPLSIPDTQL